MFMDQIKVYLRMSSHPVFKYLAAYPPKGIVYNIPQKGFTLKSSSKWAKGIKKMAWQAVTKFRPPYLKVEIGENDLIHSCHGMLISNNDPWVVDVEHAPSFANYNIAGLERQYYKNKIMKLLDSENCKKIMPWTEASKKSVENIFMDQAISRKLEVVYPAIDIKNVKIKKDDSSIKFLVVSRFFYEKGGKQALEVFEKLDKKYDVEMAVLSIVPEEIKKKYGKYKNIKFIEKIFVTSDRPNAIFEEYYSKYHALIHLTFGDTFGLASLEAMSCRMPIIGTDMFSMPEIVEDGRNGFTIKSPISCLNPDFSIKYSNTLNNMDDFMKQIMQPQEKFISEASEKASMLIEDSKLRNKMGGYGRKLVETGKFSIQARNKKLRKIYQDIAEK